MKKNQTIFAVSLITIVVGIITASAYGIPKEKMDYPRLSYVSQAWSVSANITKGDFVYAEIRQGSDWPVGLFDPSDEYPGLGALYVGVNITDPRGNSTLFLITYGQTPEAAQQDYITPVTILDINLTSYNGGGLDATPLYKNETNSYWDVGGIAQLDGNYTFTIVHIMPHREEPPSSIDIRKRITLTIKPYTYLLPVGITLAAAGSALMWFSFKKKPKTNFSKRKTRAILRKRRMAPPMVRSGRLSKFTTPHHLC